MLYLFKDSQATLEDDAQLTLFHQSNDHRRFSFILSSDSPTDQSKPDYQWVRYSKSRIAIIEQD